ncbi:TIR domain-containing protein [Oleiharenicola lentus]|uniref:TIR domain-containing protein n=1 Tax=Oleiharenicola lentus TaxID=2508720 RepID=UPI003F671A10
MARRVFFSFHYKNDNWRVSQIRNSWVTKDHLANQFMDAAAWEQVQRKGDANVKAWIDRQLKGTGVTVVLIGAETASRKFVHYEIEQSLRKGNALLGIFIHKMKDRRGQKAERGQNPLDAHEIDGSLPFFDLLFGKSKASDKFRSYDWVDDNGYAHLNSWIEEAAVIAGR